VARKGGTDLHGSIATEVLVGQDFVLLGCGQRKEGGNLGKHGLHQLLADAVVLDCHTGKKGQNLAV